MLAGRRTAIVIGAVVLALVGFGGWRHAQLVDDRATARAQRVDAIHELRQLEEGLRTAERASGAVESNTLATRHSSEALVTLTGNLAGEIAMVERQRIDAAVGAYVAGGRVSRLRECLDGINRALNQISVGDANGPASLGAVSESCRAVGA